MNTNNNHNNNNNQLPLIVGISGASGAIYGVRLLEILQKLNIDSHLVISESGERTIKSETPYDISYVHSLASEIHDIHNIGASIASGSFKTQGMIIAPCSITTLSAVANSFNHNLLIRASDVCLKEKRNLLMMIRETPLHQGHLELMAKVASYGATIIPPVPAFYHLPKTIDDVINHTIGKCLDQLKIEHNIYQEWQG